MEKLPSQEESISFEGIAKIKGYSPKKSRRDEYKDVSHILKAKGQDGKALDLRFDLKKRKNKKQSEEWIWVEFKNSKGQPGWLHGNAHFIAFERELDFLIVNRKELVDFLGSCKKIRYDLPFVSLAKKAKYKIYKRPGKKEEITQINFIDLSGLKSFKIWKKEYAEAE